MAATGEHAPISNSVINGYLLRQASGERVSATFDTRPGLGYILGDEGSRKIHAPKLAAFVIETMRSRGIGEEDAARLPGIESVGAGLEGLYTLYRTAKDRPAELKARLAGLDKRAEDLGRQQPAFGVIEEARAAVADNYPDAELVFIDIRRAFALALESTASPGAERPFAA